MKNITKVLSVSACLFVGLSQSAMAQVQNNKVLKDSKFPIQIGLTGLFSAGASSVETDALGNLQAGGHDPSKNGFSVQNVELTLSSTVDQYFDANANLIYLIDAEGETVVELEEAYAVTRSLPAGLQIKAGQFYTEFGRQNVLHPHAWAFVDQPVILSRLFGGDGLRSQGARMSWLLPTSWYSEWYLGVQNASGETVSSFLSVPGEDIGGYELQERSPKKFSDMLISSRLFNATDLSDQVSINVGVSGLFGPNSSGPDNKTQILGADLYLKWQAVNSQRGYPFVAWHTEYLQRDYEAGSVEEGNQDTLTDAGYFSQLMWGFKPGWIAGLRYEAASGNGDSSSDSARDKRTRISPNVTWYLSEYSKLRLQYNYDETEHLEENTHHSVWMQFEFSIGSHAAHTF